MHNKKMHPSREVGRIEWIISRRDRVILDVIRLKSTKRDDTDEHRTPMNPYAASKPDADAHRESLHWGWRFMGKAWITTAVLILAWSATTLTFHFSVLSRDRGPFSGIVTCTLAMDLIAALTFLHCSKYWRQRRATYAVLGTAASLALGFFCVSLAAGIFVF
ncbi:hypothetical protein [Rhodopirellula sallentina]|uniref:hypothetical protein n=1 Tax=Rhodopirellula sallentina TaxID=1263869 RepID=UPI0005C7CF22|nr:hypothetical protein [Rhodopirellula sallentina]